MNRKHLRLVLPLFALLLPTARTASATPPDKPAADSAAAMQAKTEIDKQLVKPLANKEAHQSRFSRAYIPPQERRVRVLESEGSTDGRGAEFLTFAVDERSGAFARRGDTDAQVWRKDEIVGCVYPARAEVFIKLGTQYFAPTLLLGKRTPAADATVCQPARVAAVGKNQ
jgi:hypothetical protein